MADDLAPGLYEELVSAAIVGRLAAVEDALVERVPLRPADAADRVAQHLAREVLRAIDAVPEPRVYTPRAKNLALLLLPMTQFVIVIDASIVNVALPSIGGGLPRRCRSS